MAQILSLKEERDVFDTVSSIIADYERPNRILTTEQASIEIEKLVGDLNNNISDESRLNKLLNIISLSVIYYGRIKHRIKRRENG